jgi:hypothetical protein
MKRNLFTIPGLLLALAVVATSAPAQVILFADNFESGNLNQWTGKTGYEQHGQIVADPFNPSNQVVNFFELNGGGDMYSASPVSVDGTQQQIMLSFDFLALPITSEPPPEYGGFVGIADDYTGTHPYWVAGTYPPAFNVPASMATVLATNGLWNHYEIDITEAVVAFGLTNLLITLEDVGGLGSVPGDVYFDNVKLTAKLDPAVIEQLVPCDGPITGGKWKNHGQYVSTMSDITAMLVTQGLITPEERDAYVSAAAKSSCGEKERPGCKGKDKDKDKGKDKDKDKDKGKDKDNHCPRH